MAKGSHTKKTDTKSVEDAAKELNKKGDTPAKGSGNPGSDNSNNPGATSTDVLNPKGDTPEPELGKSNALGAGADGETLPGAVGTGGESKEQPKEEPKQEPKEEPKEEEPEEIPAGSFKMYGVNVTPPSEDEVTEMAGNADFVLQCRRVVARAEELEAERNRPIPKTIPEMEADNYARLQQKYGKDFVTAERKKNTKYFSRMTWNSMGNNKQGWKEVTKTMPELKK